ncbi:MAG: glycosyl hydrolase [Planctomycetes bacterium]|nr:glycosyl hydrolase [Planctomycetota bacterium]
MTPKVRPQDQPQDRLLAGLHWREIGPYRGGRACAVAGIPGDADTFWMGSCGGGVWRTDDAGRSWRNVSDGSFGGSIGGIDVCAEDPNVVWVGTGEKTVRGNVSHGEGVWRSTDGGRSWQHVGLADTRQIGRVRAHPRDPDCAWVAAIGHLYGPNEERGVFRTRDGGRSWQRVLFVDADTGAVDLLLDPGNPRIVYATTWRVRRSPWSLESGGAGSGLWKSLDGGDTWRELTRNEGLPAGTIGICGIAVSPSNPDNLYAQIEAEDGGLFRSRDAGKTWTKVDDDRERRQRAWYYTRVVADPADEDGVWVLNVRLWHSKDGGKTFRAIPTPHGDNHDLWIDPRDPRRMVESNDGGANVSVDGGESWSAQDNQPTAQMYRVSLDDEFPYRLLGGQQDNSALRIRSRNVDGGAIGERDFESTAGGESGHVVAQPGNPDLVFGGSYGGYLEWQHHRTGESRRVNPWPDSVMGFGARDARWRFQWNFPLFFSPHEPGRLYAAAQALFVSEDLGASWRVLSPDLSRNDRDKQGPSGGPITKDNTGVEYYGTIFAACESPARSGVLWCGSDDGRIHVSQDGGASWSDVTPAALPEFSRVNCIDAHPREPGTCYVAATRYQLDEFRPLLFRTRDFGARWDAIVGTGIAADHFTRAIRVDPERDGLLYVGTERGPYVSHDDGVSWRSLRNDLPIVPITDLAVRGDELVAATQGRGYWILNGLAVLRGLERAAEPVALFAPPPAWRVPMGRVESPRLAGENPHAGLVVRYWLDAAPDAATRVELEFQDAEGNPLRIFTRKTALPKDSRDSRDAQRCVLEPKAGLNVFAWDLRIEGARRLTGTALWNGNLAGPQVPPGEYRCVLRIGEREFRMPGELRIDPRTRAGLGEHRSQFEFLRGIVTKLDAIHAALLEARRVRDALRAIEPKLPESVAGGELRTACEALRGRIDALEERLCQPRSKSAQDPLNFPVGRNDRLAALQAASGGYGPTAQDLAVRDELLAEIDPALAELEKLLADELPALELRAREVGAPVIR